MRNTGLAAMLAALALGSLGLGAEPLLYGTRQGLFKKAASGPSRRLWGPGEVKRILRTPAGWFILCSEGLLHSSDLSSFDARNAGLPVKTLKTFKDGVVGYAREVQDLKDVEVDPANHLNMALCTKDDVFLSRDAGLSWTRYPTPVKNVTGLKAVAVYSAPRLTLIASHPIRGLFALRPDDAKPSWTPFITGLDTAPGMTAPDEIADIKAADFGSGILPWVSGSFKPEIYAWNREKGAFAKVLKSAKDFGMVESLCPIKGGMAFVSDGGLGFLRLDGAAPAADSATPWKEARDAVLSAEAEAGAELESIWFEDSSGTEVSLNELWLLDRTYSGPRAAAASKREGIYLPTGFINSKLDDYAKLLSDRGLNMITVDLKDDFGKLRYVPRNEYVKSIGKVSGPIDVEAFVKAMKARGIYIVARIVVFKDQVVQEAGKGKYSVWDSKEGKPWRGYFMKPVEAPSPGPSPVIPSGAPIPLVAASPSPSAKPAFYRDYNEEYWVDPYCEWVWKYNVEIAKEIVDRGFDEIQFDYIRFPTDGDNLANASYRYKGEGMDMESALMSFLSYARESVRAPISADIYGANGWYRTGVRTGQDVELLSRYVDAVCPMFYPSHFEQDFLAAKPAEERPYRIYYLGTLRNVYIGRFRLVVRPYVQAFKMNVRYDRQYYGLDYVRREIDGVRTAADMGMTFWNSGGRYNDVPDMRTLTAGELPRADSLLD
jgi:hypothetical protein